MNRYVALLDILGFKEMVCNNDHDWITNFLETKISGCVNSSADIFQQTTPEQNTLKKIYPVNYALISDSICLWTEDDAWHMFQNLIETVSRLLSLSMTAGIPLRGSITHGALSFSNTKIKNDKPFIHQSLVGKALVEAYLEEKQQEWSGCVISDAAMNDFVEKIHSITKKSGDKFDFSRYMTHAPFLKYPVPMKGGEIKERWVVNWILRELGEPSEKDIRHHFSRHKKSVNRWEVETKIKNTVDFLKVGIEDKRLLIKKLKDRNN